MDSWEQSKLCTTSIQQRPESPAPQTGHNEFDEPPADNSYTQGMQSSQGSYQYSGNTWGFHPETSGFVHGGVYQQNFRQSMNKPPSYYPQQRPTCFKCGRLSHWNINFCPAINETCFGCGRVGHYHRCYRAKHVGNFEDSIANPD